MVIALSHNVMANDVRIKGEVKLQAYDASTALITFPLTWEHSWRESENWDAVWIFVKYKRVGVNEPWHHAYLKDKGHKVAGRSDIPAMEFLPVYTTDYWEMRHDVINRGSALENTTGKTKDAVPGLFLFRKKPGTGKIDIPRVSLEWIFTEGDLNLTYNVTLDDIRKGRIEVSVQAIEMVYVPVGPYYLGDRTSAYSFVNERVDAGTLVTSEAERKFHTMGEIASNVSDKAWIVPANYPKGYHGFYSMKYEVSQEQYVNFLNRITLRDQKKRIGRDLSTLNPGEYVFGNDANKAEPSYRNGIVLVEKYSPLDTPAVFGFDLSQITPNNFGDDGKSVACNFLSPEDLKAYMDWIGLRPHSEMEYEKACRERNPMNFFADRSFAWGTPDADVLVWTDVSNMGKENEQVGNNKNVNGGGPNSLRYASPVRCGAFATEVPDMIRAGASRWGLMEMTGNMAEICYNAEGGMNFRGDVFGDGNIWSTVCTWKDDSVYTVEAEIGLGGYVPWYIVHFSKVINYPTISKRGNPMSCVISHDVEYQYCKFERYTYDKSNKIIGRIVSAQLPVPFPFISWPDTTAALGFRGGSCNDDTKNAMAVSYRKEASAFVSKTTGLDTRLKFAGFRGGRSVPIRSILAGEIAAANNLRRDTAVICSAVPYTISQIVEGEDDPLSSIYFWEINDGTGWREIEGKQGKDLVLDWTVNDSLAYKEYSFRRHSIASHAEAYSNEVKLCIPGHTVSGVDGKLNIGPYEEYTNVFVELGTKANVGVWKVDYSDTRHPLDGRVNVSEIQQFELNRTNLDPPVVYGDNGVIDIIVTVNMEGCPFETKRVLSMDKYANVTPVAPITDARDNQVYNTVALSNGWTWMSQDLKFNVTKGDKDGFEWPAAVGGNYTPDHIIACANGKLELCPEGYALPNNAEWDDAIKTYGIGDGSYDENSGILYDPGLSNFVNAFFGVSSGSSGFHQNSGKWWSSSRDLYGFGDFFGLYFGYESGNDGNTYRVRCVKIRK